MKKFIMLLLGVSLMALSGCDDDDDKKTTETDSTNQATDVEDVKSLNWHASGDPHNLVGLYGSLASFADLPVNFNIVYWASDGANVSVPEGEDNLDPLGGEHMQKRRALILAFSGSDLIHTEDFASTYNSHIGSSYGRATHLMAIHCKNGSALSRTKLTSVDEI